MPDILFITRCNRQRENSVKNDIYQDLRLSINGQVATLDYLRKGAVPLSETPAPERCSHEDACPPVLTPFYMEEYLRRRDISVETVDCLEDSWEDVQKTLAQGVGLIAVSTTWESPLYGAAAVRNAVARLRTLAPKIPIVVGGMAVRKGRQLYNLINENKIRGLFPDWLEQNRWTSRATRAILRNMFSPHAFLMNGQADRFVDAFTVGDFGEESLVDLIQAIRKNEGFNNVPNLAWSKGKSYFFTEEREVVPDIDAEIIDWSRYIHRLNGYEAPMRSSTGCPFRCKFCDFHGLHPVAMRSMPSMIQEIRTLVNAMPEGMAQIFFVDDNLSVNKARLQALAKAIIDSRLKVTWKTFLRVDSVDEPTAVLMKESGCSEVYLGIESGDKTILKNMAKVLNPDISLQGILALDKVGIRTMSTFVVGFPGESRETISNTAQFISAIPSGAQAQAFHCYYLFGLVVAPLSPLSTLEQRRKFKLRGIVDSWSHATMSSRDVPQAMRELFLKVSGPTHVYKEKIPANAKPVDVRRVFELREKIQKTKLRTSVPPDKAAIQQLVSAAAALDGSGLT